MTQVSPKYTLRSRVLLTIVFTTLIMLLGFFSGLFASSEIEQWYLNIKKPSFNPPNFIFGPVWSLLYMLMGISVSIIYFSDRSTRRVNALIVFLTQFVLNLAWSAIFFNFHAVGWAFVEICVLWLSILATIFTFLKVNGLAAYLQIPYLLWVSFAALLNISIYLLN